MGVPGLDSGMGRRPPPPDDYKDSSRGERLQRVMADGGIASRRKCEQMIVRGLVEVNGRVVDELPAWVDPELDRIVADGRVVPKVERHLYIMLNKPSRTLTTAEDEPGSDRRTVMDLVDHPAKARLFPVGRLDYTTTGLVLLTNDGDLANRLTHPSFGVPKTYKAKLKGSLDDEALAELERGIYLAERKAGHTVGAVRTSKVELSIIHKDRDSTWLEITLREGRNRQVRRMLAAVGYPVKSLERTAMGPVRLKGVARGAWRELTAREIQALRRSAAQSPPKKAGPGKSQKRSGKGGGRRSPTVEADKKPSGLTRRRIKDAAHKAGGGRPNREDSP